MSQEKSEVLNLLAKSNAELKGLQMHAQRLQMKCDQLHSISPEENLNVTPSDADTYQHIQLEFVNSDVGDSSVAEKKIDSSANKSENIEMKAQMKRLTETLQRKDTELQKVSNENEALKIKFDFYNYSFD